MLRPVLFPGVFEEPWLPVSLCSCNCCTISVFPLFFYFILFFKCRSHLDISSSHQAVPGGAAQCHRAQRCGTAGHLHRQRGKRRNLCLQSYWRQHCPPSGIRVWRPITGGTNASLGVRKVSGCFQQHERNSLPDVLQGKEQYRNTICLKCLT